jgi:CDP-diacylglycerol---serine O-phosphatidyltransferase
MNVIKKQIPNLITLGNLFCGCIALVFVAKFQFDKAFFFVFLGIFLDFFDGFFARIFKVSSPLGLQLDSLADMVTSGVVPGFVVFQMFQGSAYDPELISVHSFFGFFITLGACFRLAKFNIDTRQTDSFIGLPTPANAIFILSLPLIKNEFLGIPYAEIIHTNWFLITITIFSVIMMNSEIALFSLKIKSKNLMDNKLQIGFMLLCIVLLLLLKILAIPVIIISYILISVVNTKISKKAVQ